MSRSRAAAAALGVLVIAGASCKASAPMKDAAAPPMENGDAGGAAGPVDELDALQTELSLAQGELDRYAFDRQVGAAVEEVEPATSPGPEPRPATPQVMNRCERVRTLAQRICELSDRMCTLAGEHEGEQRYQDACGRAEQSCEEARIAADGCEPGS
ncbi:MAG: hypothetical protein KC501_41895 [Myxococcales bacterium]|nr:hypothetical protein [Myxococcales bacterium]